MRDDFGIPNMGEAGTEYEKSYFNRLVRNIEMTFRSLKSKGLIQATTITADEISASDANFTGKVRLADTGDVTPTGDAHPFQIGASTANNVAMDSNEIMARSNGVVSPLHLNADGGEVIVNQGPTAATGIKFDGLNNTISRTSTASGLVMAGGNSATNGANIELYGGSHATDANRAFYDASEHLFRNQGSTVARMHINSRAGTIFFDSAGVGAINMSNNSNGAIEIGKVDGSVSTPFIDFHSGATVTDYDVRIMASGGTGTNGQGRLTIYADDGLALQFGKIRFPVTQNPSTDANTLDDYEEGTWTPIVSFGFGTTGITYSIQGGYYVKVGQMVVVQLRTIFTAKGSSTGNARIGGLPFTCTSATGQAYTPVTWGYYAGFTGLPTPTGYIETGNAYINLMFHGATAVGAISDASFTNTSDMIITAVYRASA